MRVLAITESTVKNETFRHALQQLGHEAVCLQVPAPLHKAYIRYALAELDYRLYVPKSSQDQTAELNQLAASAGLILLATNPTPFGEAIAASAHEALAWAPRQKTIRYEAAHYHPFQVQLDLERLLELPFNQRPTVNQVRAHSFWIKSVISRVWTALATTHLGLVRQSEKQALAPAVSPTAVSILKLIETEEEIRRTTHQPPYHEIHACVNLDGQSLPAQVVVPPPAEAIGLSSPTLQFLWQFQLEQSKQRADHNLQPLPGHPWRYLSRREAERVRTGLLKNPRLALIRHQTGYKALTPDPPHTCHTLLEWARSQRGLPYEETLHHLRCLHYLGHVTLPLTNNPNLSDAAYRDLRGYAARKKIPLANGKRHFQLRHDSDRTAEALRPTHFNFEPDSAEEAFRARPELPHLATLYRQIFEQTLRSQQPQDTAEHSHYDLIGPLPERAAEGDPTPARELRIKSQHLTLLRATTTGFSVPTHPKTVARVESAEVRAVEPPPRAQGIPDDKLLQELDYWNISTPETYARNVEALLKDGLIARAADRSFVLTDKGRGTLDALAPFFSCFMDIAYNRELQIALRRIEIGDADPHDFLRGWWAELTDEIHEIAPLLIDAINRQEKTRRQGAGSAPAPARAADA